MLRRPRSSAAPERPASPSASSAPAGTSAACLASTAAWASLGAFLLIAGTLRAVLTDRDRTWHRTCGRELLGVELLHEPSHPLLLAACRRLLALACVQLTTELVGQPPAAAGDITERGGHGRAVGRVLGLLLQEGRARGERDSQLTVGGVHRLGLLDQSAQQGVLAPNQSNHRRPQRAQRLEVSDCAGRGRGGGMPRAV